MCWRACKELGGQLYLLPCVLLVEPSSSRGKPPSRLQRCPEVKEESHSLVNCFPRPPRSAPPSPCGRKPSRPASSPENPEPAELRCAGAGSRPSPAAEDGTAAGERFGEDTGPLGAAAMLPSLQESLDGDEKELESSEEGGSAEERRLEPPPSSHYCLYSYRGSRCRVRPPGGPAPAPPRPRAPRPGCS